MTLLVIMISGPTCSGKTSLANKLQEKFPDSILINQDKYFLPKDDPRHTLVPELNHFNWEILSSLDMEKMHSDILKIIRSMNPNTGVIDKKNRIDNILILEGFAFYNYKPIQDLCSSNDFHKLKYFITLSRETCWDRRKIRVYDPPDVPGYFDMVVWPEYLKYKSGVTSDEDFCKDVTFIDGDKNLNELCDEVINEINSYILSINNNKNGEFS